MGLPQRAVGADGTLQDLGSESLPGASFIRDCHNQPRLHHATIVSNGIVEGKQLNGREPHFVTIGDLREAHSRPGFLPWMVDIGYSFSADSHFNRRIQTELMDAFEKVLLLPCIALGNQFGDSDVGRDFENTFGSNLSKSPLFFVVGVGNLPLFVDPDPVAGIHYRGGINFIIFESGHQGG